MPCLVCFMNYLTNIGANKHQRGGSPSGHNPPRRARTPRHALVGCGPHVGPLTYLFIPHHHLPPEKNIHCSLSRVLALKPADFDLFAQSSVFETVSGIVAWYVTPLFVQLVFVLVVYILNN